jgi:hypothetical protein
VKVLVEMCSGISSSSEDAFSLSLFLSLSHSLSLSYIF